MELISGGMGPGPSMGLGRGGMGPNPGTRGLICPTGQLYASPLAHGQKVERYWSRLLNRVKPCYVYASKDTDVFLTP